VAVETLRYTYRLRPGAEALRVLNAEWGRCRWLWNEAVHQHRSGKRPTLCKLSKLLTAERARSGWLRSGSQNAQAQELPTYAQSLERSFRVKGRCRPMVKRRKVAVVCSRDLPSEPTSVRVFQDSLIERAQRAGRKVVMVPPAYTTMTCSECFARAKRRLGLGQRVFRCEFCGYSAERDRNAARVILALARRILDTEELSRASVDGVRHFPAPFEGAAKVLPELGICLL
jgi:transposase